MRIALVHPFSWPQTRRGGERYLHDLGWYLSGAGHDVEILTGRDDGLTPSEEEIDGCRVRRVWSRPGRIVRRLPSGARRIVEVSRIRRALRADWDLVHCLWPTAAEAAAANGHRVLYTLLGMPTDETAAATLNALQFGAEAATASAALSHAASHHAEHLFDGPWIVLPPGLRSERFPLRDHPRVGPPTFLFSAALSVGYKGLPDLLQAFAIVVREMPESRLVLSGQGDHTRWLPTLSAPDRESVLARLEVAGTGDLRTAEGRYEGATVTVLPSRHEAFGLSVIESLAVGTPVVACDDGGPAEILAVPGVGETVPFSSPVDLAGAMIRTVELARDPATPQRCAQRAARWDWSTSIGPLHEAVYDRLLDGDLRPGNGIARR